MTGCWLWLGAPSDATSTGQYGRFRIAGRQERAHRAAWMLFRGAVPIGMHVLHRCDVPACVNPQHLFLGRNDDNVADRVSKNRTDWVARQGDDHPMRKLTADQVRDMRRQAGAGVSQSDIAIRFGVHRSTVCEIVKGRKWAHLT